MIPETVKIGADVGSRIASFLGDLSGLFGFAPRGDYAKFTAIILPVCKAWSQVNGMRIYVLWFGETIEIDQFGRWGVVQGPGVTESQFYQFLASQSTLDSFGHLRCSGVSFRGATVDTVRTFCNVDVYGPRGLDPVQPGERVPRVPRPGDHPVLVRSQVGAVAVAAAFGFAVWWFLLRR